MENISPCSHSICYHNIRFTDKPAKIFAGYQSTGKLISDIMQHSMKTLAVKD